MHPIFTILNTLMFQFWNV
uniref:Uncharacterized protein n=1 Tax=Arundo donax TaxID=35708 RepID=A0A0A8Z147_ARUDO